MKLFKCIIDTGDHVFKAFTTGNNKKEMLDRWGGNGDFEKIEDVTVEYFAPVKSVDKLEMDLQSAGWGEGERKLLCALLEDHIRKTKK